MAIIGMFLQEGLTGSACGACAWYPASPLRAFANELGVLAAVGFCDPAGFTTDGYYENFASNCQTERGSAGGACALYTASPLPQRRVRRRRS